MLGESDCVMWEMHAGMFDKGTALPTEAKMRALKHIDRPGEVIRDMLRILARML